MYEVAVSYHSLDLAVATRLVTELSEFVRGELFFAPRRQADLVGAGGDLKFTRAFRDDSKLVVVLHRAEWGGTDWTAVEESAIRDRRLRAHGTDFLVLVKLDRSPVPDWFPEVDQWFSLSDYGLERLVGVIVGKVQAAGGSTGPMTPTQRAKKLLDQQEWVARRESLITSEGVAKFKAGFAALCTALRFVCESVNSGLQQTVVDVDVDDERLVANCGWVALLLDGRLPMVRTLAQPTKANAQFLEGPVRLSGYRSRPPSLLTSEQLAFAPMAEDLWLWHGEERMVPESADEVATRLVNQLVDLGLGERERKQNRGAGGRNGFIGW